MMMLMLKQCHQLITVTLLLILVLVPFWPTPMAQISSPRTCSVDLPVEKQTKFEMFLHLLNCGWTLESLDQTNFYAQDQDQIFTIGKVFHREYLLALLQADFFSRKDWRGFTMLSQNHTIPRCLHCVVLILFLCNIFMLCSRTKLPNRTNIFYKN